VKSSLPWVVALALSASVFTVSTASAQESRWNAEASAPFNLQNNNVGRATTVNGSNTEAGGYLVNPDGTLEMPILGTIQAAGFTKEQLRDNITNMILSKKLLVDPIVDIRYLNYEVTVLGEVAHPTVIPVPNEKISLLKDQHPWIQSFFEPGGLNNLLVNEYIFKNGDSVYIKGKIENNRIVPFVEHMLD